jgi:hydrogenase-4 component B
MTACNSMSAFILCMLFPAAAALISLPFRLRPRLQAALGAGSAILASTAGLLYAGRGLAGGATLAWHSPWSMPFGSFSLTLDPLSALFLVPLFILSSLGSFYAVEYTKNDGNKGLQWLFYNVLVASMAFVVTASNGLLFLVAWEIMSLSSFACVLSRYEKQESQEAAWIYLIATHIGTAFLLLFFLIAGSKAGGLDFADFSRAAFSPALSGVLFASGLIGFGSKAGFVPFHVWLPRAHPAAPSHVSALMSGIMIKMGIYGIVRSLTFLGRFQEWWGIALILIGSISGVLGVLLAIGQHDLKKLLAYHSVENIGIIALGLGAGILGACFDIPQLAVLGFCGGLLHVVNHALFKGLLFLGAGAVLHSTGTAHIESLGGLIKKMPSTAFAFLVGSMAICGHPPLNGFISEFFIYVAGFNGLRSHHVPVFAATALTMASLALIGGLAVACFTKAFGTVFLGEPRTAVPVRKDAGPFMRIPMFVLCALCLVIGALSWLLVPVLVNPVHLVTSIPERDVRSGISLFTGSLAGISAGCLVFLGVAAVAFIIRKGLLSKKRAAASPTWDCGYIAPNPRMQYTASSFAQPLVLFFRNVLFPRQKTNTRPVPFPGEWSFHSHVPDILLDNVYIPFFTVLGRILSKLRWLQGGKVHVYVLYIALTLIALLIWNFLWNV